MISYVIGIRCTRDVKYIMKSQMRVTWREKVGLNWQGDSLDGLFYCSSRACWSFSFLGRNWVIDVTFLSHAMAQEGCIL